MKNKTTIRYPEPRFYTPIPIKYSGYTQSPRQSTQLAYLSAALPVVYQSLRNETVTIIEKYKQTKTKQLCQSFDEGTIQSLMTNGKLNRRAKVCVTIVNGQPYYSPTIEKVAAMTSNYNPDQLERMVNKAKKNKIVFAKQKTEQQIEKEISKLAEEINARDRQLQLRQQELQYYRRRPEHSPEKCSFCQRKIASRKAFQSCPRCKAKMRILSTHMSGVIKKRERCSTIDEYEKTLEMNTLLEQAYPKEERVRRCDTRTRQRQRRHYRPDLLPSTRQVYANDRIIQEL